MKAEALLDLARALAREGRLEGLRLLVRAAAWPLQGEALLGFAGEELPRWLEDALPPKLLWALRVKDALPRVGEKRLWVDGEVFPVLTFPWSLKRLAGRLREQAGEAWRPDPDNHLAALYRPLGVAFVQNGLHSAAVGVLQGKVRLPAYPVDLGPLYAAGLEVAWAEGPMARFHGLLEPILHPGHALLLALGRVLWEEGVDLARLAPTKKR